MTKSLYLHCEPEQVAQRVFLTGDPARVERILAKLDNSRLISQNREFYVGTGIFQNSPITVVSSGIGAPSAAIALEELAQMGAQVVVRLGTTMGLDIPMGSFVLSSGAARFEGTSSAYLRMEFPAVPDWKLASSLAKAAHETDRPVYVGLTATYDAFYPHMAPSLAGEPSLDLEPLRAAGIKALDMETSLLYIAGIRLHLATASFCLVTNTVEPFAVLDAPLRDEGEAELIEIALKVVSEFSL